MWDQEHGEGASAIERREREAASERRLRRRLMSAQTFSQTQPQGALNNSFDTSLNNSINISLNTSLNSSLDSSEGSAGSGSTPGVNPPASSHLQNTKTGPDHAPNSTAVIDDLHQTYQRLPASTSGLAEGPRVITREVKKASVKKKLLRCEKCGYTVMSEEFMAVNSCSCSLAIMKRVRGERGEKLLRCKGCGYTVLSKEFMKANSCNCTLAIMKRVPKRQRGETEGSKQRLEQSRAQMTQVLTQPGGQDLLQLQQQQNDLNLQIPGQRQQQTVLAPGANVIHPLPSYQLTVQNHNQLGPRFPNPSLMGGSEKPEAESQVRRRTIKERAPMTIFSQIQQLELIFEHRRLQYRGLGSQELTELAADLSLSPQQVISWLYNRRVK